MTLRKQMHSDKDSESVKEDIYIKSYFELISRVLKKDNKFESVQNRLVDVWNESEFGSPERDFVKHCIIQMEQQRFNGIHVHDLKILKYLEGSNLLINIDEPALKNRVSILIQQKKINVSKIESD